MAVSHDKPNTLLFINSMKGRKGKIVGTERREAWEGFTEDVLWELSVEVTWEDVAREKCRARVLKRGSRVQGRQTGLAWHGKTDVWCNLNLGIKVFMGVRRVKVSPLCV